MLRINKRDRYKRIKILKELKNNTDILEKKLKNKNGNGGGRGHRMR